MSVKERYQTKLSGRGESVKESSQPPTNSSVTATAQKETATSQRREASMRALNKMGVISALQEAATLVPGAQVKIEEDDSGRVSAKVIWERNQQVTYKDTGRSAIKQETHEIKVYCTPYSNDDPASNCEVALHGSHLHTPEQVEDAIARDLVYKQHTGVIDSPTPITLPGDPATPARESAAPARIPSNWDSQTGAWG